ncbi:ACT domain protein [Flavobacterium sp. ACN2]|nr:ACT domain protein [Flavobacterium sp. ACN2]
MEGEINLNTILENLNPVLNEGKYVFTKVDSLEQVPFSKILFLFKEKEGITVVLEKHFAEELNLHFSYICFLDYFRSSFFFSRCGFDRCVFSGTRKCQY